MWVKSSICRADLHSPSAGPTVHHDKIRYGVDALGCPHQATLAADDGHSKTVSPCHLASISEDVFKAILILKLYHVLCLNRYSHADVFAGMTSKQWMVTTDTIANYAREGIIFKVKAMSFCEAMEGIILKERVISSCEAKSTCTWGFHFTDVEVMYLNMRGSDSHANTKSYIFLWDICTLGVIWKQHLYK